MIKFTIREIRGVSDPTPFATLIYKNFQYLEKEPVLNHNIDEIKKLLTNENFIGLLVYDNNGKMIAYLVGEIKHLNDGRITYYITYFYVAPMYRHKRIGSKLLQLLINKCKQNWGVNYITLTCDINDRKLLEFYKKRGFDVDIMLKNGGRHEIYTLYLI